jgi:hypothetical protein
VTGTAGKATKKWLALADKFAHADDEAAALLKLELAAKEAKGRRKARIRNTVAVNAVESGSVTWTVDRELLLGKEVLASWFETHCAESGGGAGMWGEMVGGERPWADDVFWTMGVDVDDVPGVDPDSVGHLPGEEAPTQWADEDVRSYVTEDGTLVYESDLYVATALPGCYEDGDERAALEAATGCKVSKPRLLEPASPPPWLLPPDGRPAFHRGSWDRTEFYGETPGGMDCGRARQSPEDVWALSRIVGLGQREVLERLHDMPHVAPCDCCFREEWPGGRFTQEALILSETTARQALSGEKTRDIAKVLERPEADVCAVLRKANPDHLLPDVFGAWWQGADDSAGT